jgi:hypothetical protein
VPGNYFLVRRTGVRRALVVVAPAYVPRPLLTVPVRYYHATPAEWRHWRREQPPRWAHNWGRDWDEHGRPSRGHDRDHDHDDIGTDGGSPPRRDALGYGALIAAGLGRSRRWERPFIDGAQAQAIA